MLAVHPQAGEQEVQMSLICLLKGDYGLLETGRHQSLLLPDGLESSYWMTPGSKNPPKNILSAIKQGSGFNTNTFNSKPRLLTQTGTSQMYERDFASVSFCLPLPE